MSINRDNIEGKLGLAGPPRRPLPSGPPLVADHELVRCIGQGSYGEVWLARNAIGLWRAVKVIHRSNFGDDRPYEREFRGITRYEPVSRSNEGLVDILQVGRNDAQGYFYYVLELADDAAGEFRKVEPESYTPRTLSLEVRRRGRLPVDECLRLGMTLSLALGFLHKEDLIHRDVKPSNIIFVNGIPKLADIGLVTEISEAGSIVGTEGFTPPEGSTSPLADIYGLGKVLYEISMGKDRHEFPEPYTDVANTPENQTLLELNAIIIKACSPNPAQRYQSAEELNADLALLITGGSVRRRRLLEKRFKLAARIGATAVAGALVAFAGFLYQSNQTQQNKRLAAANLALARQAQQNAAEAQRKELRARQNLYAADIKQIHQAFAADNLRQARDLLQRQVPAEGEPDLRGFEWRYLWRQSQSEESFSLPSHTRCVNGVVFSPDGRLLATTSLDKTTKLWDLTSRKAIATLNSSLPSRADNSEVAFSPSGDFLAVATKIAIDLWDAKTSQLVRSLPQSAVRVKFSPDGAYLVGGYTNVALWDLRTTTLLGTLDLPVLRDGSHDPNPDGVEFGLGFSSASEIALASDEGLRFLSVPHLTEVRILKQVIPRFRFVEFSADGQLVALPAPDYRVGIWNILQAEQLSLLNGHSAPVSTASFSRDGKYVATGSGDHTVKIWEASTGVLVRTFKGHTDMVVDVAFAPEGRTIASVSKDGAIKLWDLATPIKNESETLPLLPLGFRSDGNLIAFTTNGLLKTIEIETMREVRLQQFRGWGNPETLIELGYLAGDGRTAAFPNVGQARIDLFDFSESRHLGSIAAEPPLAFAPKRRLVAVVGADNLISIHAFENGARRYSLTNDKAEIPMVFSPDESILATSFKEGSDVRLWTMGESSAHELQRIKRTELVPGPHTLQFSPDGKILARGTWEGAVTLLKVPSGDEVASLVGHKDAVSAVCFSPDGKTLATASRDSYLRLWQVSTGRELMSFSLGFGFISGLVFSPDGTELILESNNRDQTHRMLIFRGISTAELAPLEGMNRRSESDISSMWFRDARRLKKEGLHDSAVKAFSSIIGRLERSTDPVGIRRSALRGRSEILKQLGRFDEAESDHLAALNLPEREAATPQKLIDLSMFFNASLDVRSTIPPEPFLEGLPQGIHGLPGSDGIQFDLRGVVRLDNSVVSSAENIPVRQTCKKLHFLHGSGGDNEPDDTHVASYVIHYSNGLKEEFPIRYGRELRNWIKNSDDGGVDNARVPWTGANATRGAIRLFQSTWTNPHDEKEIRSIDFVSKQTLNQPFLIAITAE